MGDKKLKMNKHFLQNIEINNFKCFDTFKADGFKRINLIGGKNNVGKTAFMEACYINVYAMSISTLTTSLVDIKFMRENINIIASDTIENNIAFIELSNDIHSKSNINETSFHINKDNGKKQYQLKFNKQSININANDFTFEHTYMNHISFIDNFGFSNSDIVSRYAHIQEQNKEQFLNEKLNNFDSNIKSFKVINNKAVCEINDKYLELSELGDGSRHLISIIVSLYRSQNGYLFIDEIDNGIHYSMMSEIWELIFQLSRELNVQIFATTHSKECIQSYAKTIQSTQEKDITFIELGRDKKNNIQSITLDDEMFLSEIKQNHEVRGW